MCGIAGIVRFGSTERPVAEVEAMVGAMRHRGPDDQGTFVANGLGIGMRRLAIIDLSAAGHQPMTNQRGTTQVVYNGEIYNYLDLRSRLTAAGYAFKGHSDTEVLPHGYAEFGALGLVKRLEGMFAIAIVDLTRKLLFLARDPFGVKPLYLRRAHGQLSFASEIRALSLDGLGRPSVDSGFISSYLRVGYVPSPRTAFEGITKLEPGTLLEVDLATGAETERVFYSLGPARQAGREVELEALAQHLESSLDLAIRRQLVSDVPLGVFLSGGLDSSTISLIAGRHLDAKVRTFSVGFERSDRGDELEAAAEVARALGATNESVKVGPESLDELASIVESLEEPLADSAVLPLWNLCRTTRRHVTVALSGEGGDEALGGYARYWWGGVAATLEGRKLPAMEVMRKVSSWLPSRTHGPLNFARRARKLADTIDLPESARLLSWFDIFSVSEREALHPSRGTLIEERLERLFGEAHDKGLDHVQRLQYVDMRTFLLDNLLMKSDKLSMAHGLEVRVPLIDRPLLEFGLALPVDAKVSAGTGKALLRSTMRKYLPSIARRPKRGFEPPVDSWFRAWSPAELRSTLEKGELVRRLDFSARAIGAILDRHQSGNDAGRELFALLSLELWARRFAP